MNNVTNETLDSDEELYLFKFYAEGVVLSPICVFGLFGKSKIQGVKSNLQISVVL